MLALSPSLFPTSIGYSPLEDYALGFEDQNYFSRNTTYNIDIEAVNSPAPSQFIDLPPVPPPSNQHVQAHRIDRSATPSTARAVSGDHLGVKKLNHNASERDRRKKINQLYSSLRSLLPSSDFKKKLSIPATVSQMLKYVPELQREVEGLAHKREELLSKVNMLRKRRNNDSFQVKQELHCHDHHNNQVIAKSRASLMASSFSANQLDDNEVALQITSNHNLENIPLSEVLHNLEEDGFSVLNASSFQSFGGKTFNSLHLKMGGLYRAEYYGSSRDAYNASMQYFGVVL